MDIQQQRKDLENAILFLEKEIRELEYKKSVLTKAFNDNECIVTTRSFTAVEANKIMKELFTKNTNK